MRYEEKCTIPVLMHSSKCNGLVNDICKEHRRPALFCLLDPPWTDLNILIC